MRMRSVRTLGAMLQFPVQHHPFPVVLLVPIGFAVLAIVSSGGTLRSACVSCGKQTHELCGAKVQHNFECYTRV